MTKSYNTDRNPDADYTPNDMGAIEGSNAPELWQSFVDGEIDRLKDWETNTPI